MIPFLLPVGGRYYPLVRPWCPRFPLKTDVRTSLNCWSACTFVLPEVGGHLHIHGDQYVARVQQQSCKEDHGIRLRWARRSLHLCILRDTQKQVQPHHN
ncbi:hypothetical protein DUNSADRAFT_7692 [Dunaliella salina]|uniref:Encoded protein n=1 Tax=Dunaliella salina TaxID=3046 RepID=A0ABQ7GKV7_DUNSA|nr:hypothetical protein DUNSADRAFT_7692 [Dunaliella salina]|eukprot:KAF5835245.1 hypothetical protein DUNSADRAFT_7692 [Dunaliella salina]